MFKERNDIYIDKYLSNIITNGIKTTCDDIILGLITSNFHLSPLPPNCIPFTTELKRAYKVTMLHEQKKQLVMNINRCDMKLKNLKLSYMKQYKENLFKKEEAPVKLKLPQICLYKHKRSTEDERYLVNDAKKFIQKITNAKKQRHNERNRNGCGLNEKELSNMEQSLTKINKAFPYFRNEMKQQRYYPLSGNSSRLEQYRNMNRECCSFDNKKGRKSKEINERKRNVEYMGVNEKGEFVLNRFCFNRNGDALIVGNSSFNNVGIVNRKNPYYFNEPKYNVNKLIRGNNNNSNSNINNHNNSDDTLPLSEF